MYQFNREEYEARMKWYQEARFGMFIHWGLYSIPARGEWVRSTEEIPEEEYLPFMKEFDARDYNPKQWAKEAKEALSYAEDVYCTRKIIRKRHIQRMKDGDCSPDIGVYFLDIISSMERIAGYAFTIARYILSQNDEEE